MHTRGSDGRQYRGVLNDAEITERFRVIAFDMPWHGKSSPPQGSEREEYRLTRDFHTSLVVAISQASSLDWRPSRAQPCRHARRALPRAGCRPRRTSRPTTTPSGCIMPTCTVAKCAPASCRDSSSPPRSRHAVRDHAGSRIPERFLGHLRPVLNEVAAS